MHIIMKIHQRDRHLVIFHTADYRCKHLHYISNPSSFLRLREKLTAFCVQSTNYKQEKKNKIKLRYSPKYSRYNYLYSIYTEGYMECFEVVHTHQSNTEGLSRTHIDIYAYTYTYREARVKRTKQTLRGGKEGERHALYTYTPNSLSLSSLSLVNARATYKAAAALYTADMYSHAVSNTIKAMIID